MLSSSKLAPGGVVGLMLHFRTVTSSTECLQSLLADGVRAVIVVDNSEDGGRSLRRLRDAVEPLLAEGLELDVVEPGRNLGFAAGVNAGLARARARFGPAEVLLVNSDATLDRGAVSALQRSIGRGAGLATPVLLSPDGARHGVAYYHRFTGMILRRPRFGCIRHLSGCCLLISRSLAASDLLNESFFFYGEDAFLGWRMSQEGVACVVAEDAIAHHAGSGSSRRGSYFYEYHMARAHLELGRQLATGPFDHAWLLLGRGAFLPLRAVWRMLRQRSLAPLLGLARASIDQAAGTRRSLTPPP